METNMKKLQCASCNTDQNVRFYDKGQTQYGYFKIGWELCPDCYNREVNWEHDKQEQREIFNKGN